MCGRYSLHSSPEVVALQFGLERVPGFEPRYNIAPGAAALIVKADGAALAHWGFKGKMHNARAETLPVKLSFRTAYHRRRCLVPASGFYEWKRAGALKQPYYVQPSDKPLFAFAGLWETWQDKQAFTLITTAANLTMQTIHDRMPLIIAPEHYAGWLYGEEGLMRPAPPGAIRCHPVSPAVNHAASESPTLIAPLDSEIQKSIFN